MLPPKTHCYDVCISASIPPPIGGMGVQAERLVRHLSDEGLSVTVLRTNPAPPRFAGWTRSVFVIRTIVRTLQYITAMSRHVPRSRAVHHFAASGLHLFMFSVPLLMFCLVLRKPVIFNYRSGDADDFFRCWGWLVLPLIRRAKCVAVPSEFLRGVFAKYGITAVVLPNISETCLFGFKERHHFAPRLVVARNLKPVYDIECIIHAFRIVHDKYPDAALGIVGTGPEEDHLRSLVDELQLSSVSFYGRVENREMPRIYCAHDIAVNASKWDNFPGAIVEAALSGLAIVSTSAGGIRCMIENGKNGLLVNVGDAQELAKRIIETVENPAAAHERTLRARMWAEQFAWPNVFRVFSQIYGLPTRDVSKTASPQMCCEPESLSSGMIDAQEDPYVGISARRFRSNGVGCSGPKVLRR